MYTERSMHVCVCTRLCVLVLHACTLCRVPCANVCCHVLAACACVFPTCTCVPYTCVRVCTRVQVHVYVHKQTDYSKAPLA